MAEQVVYEQETYQIERVELGEQPTAVIQARITVEEIPEWMGGVFGEVWGYMAQAGMEPAGPPFARYLSMNEPFEVEAGFPVNTPMQPAGRMHPSVLPAGPAATTTHLGPYETLHEAYRALEQWVDGHGYQQAGPFWEMYFTDPNEEPDVSKWRTQLVMPIRPKA